jgi:hypothetical protein
MAGSPKGNYALRSTFQIEPPTANLVKFQWRLSGVPINMTSTGSWPVRALRGRYCRPSARHDPEPRDATGSFRGRKPRSFSLTYLAAKRNRAG